ncbi:MAG TPA: hypothetical protein VGO86_03220, partial [Candidatus Dormibacteraeota bacterium]
AFFHRPEEVAAVFRDANRVAWEGMLQSSEDFYREAAARRAELSQIGFHQVDTVQVWPPP